MDSTKAASRRAFISTLTPEFIPKHDQPYKTESKLIHLTSWIIVCVYWNKDGLNSISFNLKTRKPLQKATGREPAFPYIPSNVLAIKAGNQNLIFVRTSDFAFKILSIPRLAMIDEFIPTKTTNAKVKISYFNGEIITWIDNHDVLTFWKPFNKAPISSLRLPFTVKGSCSQIVNQNLLIFQNEKSKQLVFVDACQKQVIGTTKAKHNLYHSINSEDMLFSSWLTFGQGGAIIGQFICERLTHHLKRIPIGTIELNWSRAVLLDGARIVLVQGDNWQFYEIVDENLLRLSPTRLIDEECLASFQIPNSEKMICLVTNHFSLLMLRLK